MKQVSRQLRTPMVAVAAVVPIVAVVGAAVISTVRQPNGLEHAVSEQLEVSGVSNPVTAVLLNFRSFDTLLEVAVLVIALLGIRVVSLTAAARPLVSPRLEDSILLGTAGGLSAIIIVTAGYLLWVGGHAPGGAFQAGALIASVCVLLWLSGHDVAQYIRPNVERVGWVAGLAVFLAAGIAVVSKDRMFLEYPADGAKHLILAIEFACAISIGAMLFAMFRSGLTRLLLSVDDHTPQDPT